MTQNERSTHRGEPVDGPDGGRQSGRDVEDGGRVAVDDDGIDEGDGVEDGDGRDDGAGPGVEDDGSGGDDGGSGDRIDLPGDEEAERPQRRRARTALLVAAGLVLLLVGGLVAATLVVQSRISAGIDWIEDPFESLTTRPTTVPPAEPGGAPAVNILVLGSDSRISAGDPSQWDRGAQRTDAIMLVHVAGDRQTGHVMSIPRDSWVDIPGYGQNKINAAFSFGGPTLMIQTVEQLTGVRIDHFAIADFESFATLTDALGGVEITLPNGMATNGVTLAPGTHTLDGEQALAYARQRYGLPGGDFDRVRRQQNWMRAILSAAFSRDVLSDPVGLTGLLETVAATLSVDEGFTVSQMRDLALSMRDLRPGDLAFLTVPVTGTGRSPDGAQSIVNLDREAFDQLMVAVAQDRVPQFVTLNPGLVSVLGADVR